MTGLERRVLTVVGEAEKLPRVAVHSRLGAVHPAQCTADEYGGRRAATLRRERGETRSVAGRPALGVPAPETEPELAGQEPHVRTRTDPPVGCDHESPRTRAAVILLEPRLAAGVELDPGLGVVVVSVGEPEAGVIRRVRRQEAEHPTRQETLRQLRWSRPAPSVARRRCHARGRPNLPPVAPSVPGDTRGRIRGRSARRTGACPGGRGGTADRRPSPCVHPADRASPRRGRRRR